MKNYSSPAPAQGKGFSPVFSGLFVVVCLGIVGSLISSLLLAFTGIREASLPTLCSASTPSACSSEERLPEGKAA